MISKFNVMIKKQVLILLFMLAAIILGSSCSHKVVYTNKWQNNNDNVQSKTGTNKSLRFYDEKSKLQYEISNDYLNLYISIKAKDQQIQSKITKGGLKVGVNTMEKNNFRLKYFIRFR